MKSSGTAHSTPTRRLPNLPHVNKKRLEAQGNLPREIEAPMWVVQEAWDLTHGITTEIQSQPQQQGNWQASEEENMQASEEHNTQAIENQSQEEAYEDIHDMQY